MRNNTPAGCAYGAPVKLAKADLNPFRQAHTAVAGIGSRIRFEKAYWAMRLTTMRLDAIGQDSGFSHLPYVSV